jgi:putative tributyrin esterase
MYFKPDHLYSGALNSRKSFYICLPNDYEQSNKYYPVIYMLHGRSGTETDWIYQGSIIDAANTLLEKQTLKDCIIVTPSDGGYDRGTFYVDWYDGSGNFEQYMLYDLIPYIDSNYRTLTSREHRVIGGLSMGGFGAFMLSMKNPHVFSAAASLSGVLGSMSHFEAYESSRMVGPAQGSYAKAYDVWELAKKLSVSNEVKPSLYFNCGTEDFLYELNLEYKQHLELVGYPFEYEEFVGEHDWTYWEKHAGKALLFFDKFLR